MPHAAISLLDTHLPRWAAPLFPDLRWRGKERSERVAYLTFDDGPSADTPRLLDVLAQYDAKATFFLLGQQVERFPGHTLALRKMGHAVGNHTYSHLDPWLSPATRILAELSSTEVTLQDHLGAPVELMRPPHGHFTPSLRAWAKAPHREMVMWDVMPGDFRPGADPDAVAQRVLRLVRPGSIIVLHDQPHCLQPVTLPALRIILKRLRAAGWRFPALSTSRQRIAQSQRRFVSTSSP